MDIDRPVPVQRLTSQHEVVDESWRIPEEAPVAFIYNQTPHAVLMGTPQDLRDLAFGFSLTEGIISNASEIENIDILEYEHAFEIKIKIVQKRFERLELHKEKRAHIGRTGCGLCGVETLTDAIKPVQPIEGQPLVLEPATIQKAVQAFEAIQPMKRKNKSVHGAAWVSSKGDVMDVREDVGRHNALDKLFGACVSKDPHHNFQDGFILLSSRLGFELIQKCALLGAQSLIGLSAPTVRAIEIAKSANMQLAVFDRQDQSLIRF